MLLTGALVPLTGSHAQAQQSDLPIVSITADQASAPEGSDVSFTLSRTGSTANTLTVSVYFHDPTDTICSPFCFPRYFGMPLLVQFKAGESTASVPVTLDHADITGPGEDQITATISTTIPRTYDLDPDAASATIVVEDPQIPLVAVTADQTSIDEGLAAGFTLQRTRNTIDSLVVNLSVSDPGSFLRGNHWEPKPMVPATATFEAGEATAGVTLQTRDDWRDIPDGQLTVAVQAPSDSSGTYEIGEASSASVMVVDDDTAPELELSVSSATAAEGDSIAFTLTRHGDRTNKVRALLKIGIKGQETNSTFTIGENSTEIVRTIATVDNDLDEDDKVYAATLLPFHGDDESEYWTVRGSRTVEITVADNDLPAVSISSESAGLSEGDTAKFTVERETDATITSAMIVTVEITQTTHATGLTTPVYLTLTLGKNMNSTGFSIPLASEDGDEPGVGTLTARIVPRTAYRIVPNHGAATVAVTDLDPTPTVTIDDATATENAGVIEFTVRYAGDDVPSRQKMEVDYRTQDGTALAGQDFVARSGTLVFAPGDTSHTIAVTVVDDVPFEDVEQFQLMLENPVNMVFADGNDTIAATGTVNDDAPRISVWPDRFFVFEGETAVFTLGRTGLRDKELSVSLQLTDPFGGNRTEAVTFAPGQSNLTFEIPTIDDDVDVPAYSVGIAILPSPQLLYAPGSRATAAMVVRDNDEPKVSISAVHERRTEGESLEYTISRSGSLLGSLTVVVSISGGDDFLSGTLPSRFTIPNGAATATLSLATVNDAPLDGIGYDTVTVAITPWHSYEVESPGSASILVLDTSYELVTVSVAADSGVVDEGETVSFTLTRSGAHLSDPLNVRVKVEDRAASSSVATITDGALHAVTVATSQIVNLTFPANVTELAWTRSTVDEQFNDGNSSITLSFLLGPYVIDDRSATVWVKDDDIPTVTIVPEHAERVEGDDISSKSRVIITRTGDTSRILPFDMLGYGIQWFPGFTRISGSILINGQPIDEALRHVGSFPSLDEIQVSPQSYLNPADLAPGNIGIGQSTSTRSFRPHFVTALGGVGYRSLVPRYCETVPGECGYSPQYRVGDPGAAFFRVYNNAQGVRVSADKSSTPEGGTITFNIHRYGGTPFNIGDGLSVRVLVTQDGDFISGTTPQTVSIEPNEWSASVSIATENDLLDEADGTIRFVVLPPLDYSAGEYESNYEPVGEVGPSSDWSSTAEVVVTDDDEAGIVISDASADEASGVIRFTVTRPESTLESTVAWATEAAYGDDAATPRVDYTTARGSVTFGVGEISTTISVAVLDDDLHEADEFFRVVLSDATEGNLVDSEAVGTIRNDDLMQIVEAVYPPGAVEGDEIVVSLQRFTLVDDSEHGEILATDRASLTVQFEIIQVGDVIVPQSATVTFAAESATATVRVSTVDDSKFEPTGSVSLEIQDGVGYTARTQTDSAQVWDNDMPITIGDVAVSEGDAQMSFMVSLREPALIPVAVDVATVDGTATSHGTITATDFGRDFEAHRERVAFAVGEQSKSFAVTLVSDHFDEESEALTAELSNPSNGQLEDARATGRIDDDDETMTVSVRGPPIAQHSEGTTEPVRLQLVLSSATTVKSEKEGTVAWIAVPDTAAHAEDYSESGGSVVIPAGQNSVFFEVNLIDDELFERALESFDVELSSAANLVLHDDENSAEIVIEDDEELQATIAAVSDSTAEGQDAAFKVTLSGGVNTLPVVLDYVVGSDSTATPGEDFAAPSGELAIPAGQESASFGIRTLVDHQYELPETIVLELRGGAARQPPSEDRAVAVTPDTATVTIDDVTGPALLINPVEGLVVAEGDTATYTVRLASPPSSDVTVAVSGHSGSDVSVSGATLTADFKLTFTAANWNQPQTVRVAAGSDNDTAADSVTLTHTAAGSTYAGTTADLAVSIVDDDAPNLVIKPSETLSVLEGSFASYTVRLATQPSSDVTVAVSGHSGSDLSLSGVKLTADFKLTFTAANWNQAQTVTVAAASDDDTADDALTLSHTAAGADYGSISADLAVTIADDDTPGVVIDPPRSLSVTEGGTAEFTVRLASEPASDVSVAISGYSGTDLSVSGATLTADFKLTFTAANWNQPQTVTVAVGSDDDTVDDFVTLTATAARAGLSSTSADLAVTIADDDTPGVVIDPPRSLSVTEGGTAEFTVRLASEPASDVSVAISGYSGTDLSVSGATLTADFKLTFTAANWNQPQTVTVAVGSDDDTVDDFVTLTATAARAGLSSTSADLAVTIADDDTPGVVIDPPRSLSVTEGGTAEFTVRLASEPASDVSVAISGYSGTDLSVSGATLTADFKLTFTAANWNQPQTVTVAVGSDDDTVDDFVTLTATAARAGLSSTSADLAVTVADDDSPQFVIDPVDGLVVTEGGAAEFTVRLASEPASDVTVAISGFSGTDLLVSGDTLSGGVLTFTSATWSTPQIVTVTAADDDDAADDTVALILAASGADYGTVAADFAVSITDDDSPSLVIDPAGGVSVGEGSSADYTLRLATQPASDVTVTISGYSGTDVSVSGTTLSSDFKLTFTAANWNQPQTVTVAAGSDNDTADDAVTLTHSATGADYAAAPNVGLPVSIRDDDSPKLVIEPIDGLEVVEGGTADYTVRLATQPASDVEVAISGHAGTDASVSGDTLSSDNKLTFTPSTWSTPQTVRVAAAEDDDAGDDEVTLTHTAAGADYGSAVADLAVAIADDDTPGLLFDPVEGLLVSEGSSADYTVRLATQPASDVEVAISGYSGTDASVSGDTLSSDNKLTFTPSTWSTPQTVRVAAAEDDDAGDDEVTLAHAASGADYGAVAADFSASIADNDSPGLVFVPADGLAVVEGGSADYTVRLATRPSGDVEVAVSGYSGTDLSVSGDTLSSDNKLTFTPSTWSTPQTVRVAAAEDEDAADDTVTLTHNVSGADYAGTAADLKVAISDDDAPGLVFDPPETLSVGEGGSADYTVRLATRPSGDVEVAVSGYSGTDASVSGDMLTAGSLTFTPANWNQPQTVSVAAAEDDDTADDEVTLVHSASGADYAGKTADLEVAISDDDTPELVFDPAETLLVGEGGTADYTVRLASEPASDVTVAISGFAGSDASISGDTLTADFKLTFTTANWNQPQTVSVAAAEDDDAGDDEVTLTHTASRAGYASTTADLKVAISDDDAPGLVFDLPVTLSVGEGGSADYTVKLATRPSGDVEVAISGFAGTDVSISGATLTAGSLTFTPANWNQAQTVSVAAAEDDDAGDDMVTLTHTAAGADYGSITADLEVAISDNDSPSLVFVPAEMLSVGEGGTAEFTVRLASEPAIDVTVAVSGHAGTDLSVSGDTLSDSVLTFTPANWNQAQTVSVAAAEDDDAADDALALTHTASGADYGGVAVDLAVAIIDNDSPSLVIDPAGGVSVGEGGSADYTVRLATRPASDVTVTISGYSGSDASVSGDTLSDSVLTFTPANWNQAQTVSVAAAEDDDTTDDEVTLVHSASGADYTGERTDLRVNVADDDTPGLVFDPAEGLSVGEGGSADYTVRLASEPAGDVEVAISGYAATDLSVSGDTLAGGVLTFTSTTWSAPQTVRVAAAEDDDAGDDMVTLTHTASRAGHSSMTADLEVAISDNDSPSLVIEPIDGLEVVEGGTAAYTVRLATQPASDVEVAISGHAGTDASVSGDTLSADFKLTFTPSTWSTPQTVSVAAAEDDDTADDEVTLVHSASGADYGSITADLAVAIDDDDSPSLVIVPAEGLSVGEGGTADYTVRLASEPAGDVEVAITGFSGTDVSVSGDTLTAGSLAFTMANWDQAQTVSVAAAEDDDAGDDMVTLTHTAAGADYGGITADLAVAIDDDDSPSLVIVPAEGLSVGEGGTADYTVRLASEPAGDVEVAITGFSGTDVSVSGDTLTAGSLAFTTANWDQAQTVSVAAAEDDDTADDEVTLVHSASGADYGGITADLEVTIDDDDSPSLVIDPAEGLSVGEGSSADYTVRLATRPAGDVEVAVSGYSGTDASISGDTLTAGSLTFTTANWDQAQTVSVAAAEDNDTADDEVTLVHSASGADYGGITADLEVAIDDDDSPSLVIEPIDGLEVVEGGTAAYTVRLATQPAGDVEVAISGYSGTDASISGATLTADFKLTFTPSTWSTPQTVSVAAAEDNDTADDEVTLVHSASGADYGGITADLEVAIDDDDSPSLVIEPIDGLEVVEGGTAAYTVRLASEPAGDVEVAITGFSGTDVSVSGDTLTAGSLAFTTANWDQAQTVSVAAAEDDDTADDEVTLVHSASGADYGGITADLEVTIDDDDSPSLVIDPAEGLSVGEGSSADYTVRLATRPAGDVEVAVSGYSGTDASISGDTLTAGSLTFTTANWDQAQTVSVAAAEDNDTADDEVTLVHSASGADYGGITADLEVAIDDDDSPSLVIEPIDGLEVVEGGTAAYTVRLATQPAGDVEVAISGYSGTDASISGATLTADFKLAFTTANWDQAQTVSVAAAEDDDTADDEVTLVHSASGADYGGITADLAVAISDNDSPSLVIVPAEGLSVGEGGTADYTVRLATEPAGDVEVAISGHAGTDASVSGDTLSADFKLTFTPSTWSTPQTVSVAAAEDDDTADDEVTLVHSASGADYGGITADLEVAIDDDDSPSLVIVPAEGLSVGEGGTADYTVRLASDPAGEVEVAISGYSGTDVSVSGDTLSADFKLAFTPSTWSTPQTVSVAAAEDDDTADDEVTLVHSASGADYGSITADLEVTVADDDARGLVFDPAEGLSVGEGGTADYTVRLASEPAGDVEVAITGFSGTDVSVSGDTLTAGSLAFTTANWDQAQTVSVAAAEDDDTADDEVTLVHSASGADYGGITADLEVTIADDNRRQELPSELINPEVISSGDNWAQLEMKVDRQTTEGQTARITITATDNPPRTPLTIQIDFAGSAVKDSDYTVAKDTEAVVDGHLRAGQPTRAGDTPASIVVTLPAGADSVVVTLHIAEDSNHLEATETIEVTASHHGSPFGTDTTRVSPCGGFADQWMRMTVQGKFQGRQFINPPIVDQANPFTLRVCFSESIIDFNIDVDHFPTLSTVLPNGIEFDPYVAADGNSITAPHTTNLDAGGLWLPPYYESRFPDGWVTYTKARMSNPREIVSQQIYLVDVDAYVPGIVIFHGWVNHINTADGPLFTGGRLHMVDVDYSVNTAPLPGS